MVSVAVPSGATLIGPPQVLPPSFETRATQKACVEVGWMPEPRKSAAPMSTSVPFGSTAIWLPWM